MYWTQPDSYCYDGTAVLKNKAGLRNQRALNEFETAMVTARVVEGVPLGRFTSSHIKAVHRQLFQDVYAWAGCFRKVRLSKGDSVFCYPENIERELRVLLAGLKSEAHLIGLPRADFSKRAAWYLSELNAIHPFRDGNGRTQTLAIWLLAANAGFSLDVRKLAPAAALSAMIESFNGIRGPLEALLFSALTPKANPPG